MKNMVKGSEISPGSVLTTWPEGTGADMAVKLFLNTASCLRKGLSESPGSSAMLGR